MNTGAVGPRVRAHSRLALLWLLARASGEVGDFCTGDAEEINNLKNAERIDKQKRDKPPLVAALRRTPQRETLPQQTPYHY